MDGVLVDSESLHYAATRGVLARYGVEYTAATNAEFFGLRATDVFAILRARHALAPTPAALAEEFATALVERIRGGAVAMPGVPEVPRALAARRLRVALASSSPREVIDATLDALGLGPILGAIVSGEEVPRGKPAPDIFLETARRLGVPPARCVVVEDSRNGMLAALAAGMACVVIPCAETSHERFDEATVRIDDLHELPGLLGDAD